MGQKGEEDTNAKVAPEGGEAGVGEQACWPRASCASSQKIYIQKGTSAHQHRHGPKDCRPPQDGTTPRARVHKSPAQRDGDGCCAARKCS